MRLTKSKLHGISFCKLCLLSVIFVLPFLAIAQQSWETVRLEDFDEVTTSFSVIPNFTQVGFSPVPGQARSYLNNNFAYAAFQAQLDPAYEYRFSWNIRASSSGKQVVFRLGTASGTTGTDVSDVFSLTTTFAVRQSNVFTVAQNGNYYLIATPPTSGYSTGPQYVYFDDFLLERHALPMPVINFAATEATLDEGGSTQICVSVDGPPLVTFNVDVALSGSADPHLSSFTTQTLTFAEGSTMAQCFNLQLEANNGQPDQNYTYTLELQNLTNGATAGEVNTMTVTVTELPPGCPWAGEDKTICAGECVYIGCLPRSLDDDDLCYSWFPQENISSTYSPFPEVCPEVTTTYTIYITNDQGDLIGTDMVTITVIPLPTVEITPPNPAICQQVPPPGFQAPGGRNNVCSIDPITLSTTATYSSYSWSTGESGPSIEVETPGPYRVTITDANGCKASKEVELAYCTETTLEVSPVPAQLCEGSVVLQANSGFETYLWSDNSTGTSLVVTEPGTYSVMVQDAGNCIAVKEIEVEDCAPTSIDLRIYNGLYDWIQTPPPAGPPMPLNEEQEAKIGAITVANLNNTDGDFMADGTTEFIDRDDPTVVAPVIPVGRNEIDLMKLVIWKKPEIEATMAQPITLKNVSVNLVNVKVWEQPTKGIPVTIPPGGLKLTSADFSSDNTKTLYIEAIDKSTAVRDIAFELKFMNEKDVVKATAIWAEQTRGWYTRSDKPTVGGTIGDPDNLDYLDEPTLIDRLNTLNIAEDGSLYGYGSSNNSQGPPGSPDGDTRLGGRHLVEYRVHPAGVNTLPGIYFDIARQRKTVAARFESGVGSPDVTDISEFPWTPSFQFFWKGLLRHTHRAANNEFPNDVGEATDEDDRLPPATVTDPAAMLLYSFDNVTNLIYASPIITATNPHAAFRMTRVTFSEFVRVSFTPFNNEKQLLGSRASGRYEWHCIHYHRRGPNNLLVIDTEPVSYSDPWIQTGEGASPNPGTISIVLAQNAQTGQPAESVQTRGYYLEYISGNKWRAKMYDINNTPIDPVISGPMQILPDESNEWVIAIPDQVTITIKKPGNAVFNAMHHRFRFNVFRTANPMGKVSEIAPGRLNFPINVTNF